MLRPFWIRIAASYVALVLLTAGLLGVLLAGDFERRAEDALQTRLTDQAHSLAYQAAPLLESASPASNVQALLNNLSRIYDTRLTLVLPDGTVIGDTAEDPAKMENHLGRPEVAGALSNPTTPAIDRRLSATVGQRQLYVAMGVQERGAELPSRILGVARVAYPLTSVEQSRDALIWSVALTVLLVSIPATALCVLIARSIAGPIRGLREAAARFGKGDLQVRAEVPKPGELADLTRDFNLMADRLSATLRERTAERNQIAAVFEQMHDGIILTDEAGKIGSINRTAARLFAVKPEEAVGRSLIEMTRDYELHNALRAALSKPYERKDIEVRVGPRVLTVVVSAVTDPVGGAPTGLVVLQDVTDVRQLERIRRDFVANIGHELRTPLSSIKLLADTLQTAIRDDPDGAKEFLKRIVVEVDGLTHLVRELQELSRLESGRVELDRRPVAVGELLERAATRLRAHAERAGLSLAVQVPDGLPRAYVDAARIEQVLVNLIHNAIRATMPGGSVTVGAEAEEEILVVRVSDTGTGIPPDDLSRIFERFYKVDKARTGGRDSEAGSGLGLSIAKHIIQAHGGRISVESKFGQGATFSFTVPAEDSRAGNVIRDA